MLGRYWHTVRHLRLSQLYGRILFRLHRPQPQLEPAPARRMAGGVWQLPAQRATSMPAAEGFEFLGQVGNLAELGWDGPQREILWRYNQHYFDDLNAEGAHQRLPWHLALMGQWVTQQTPGRGIGWAPYPTSLRMVNWIKWSMREQDLADVVQHSLAVQARWLCRRIEWHLLGNHLFVNGKALILAGLYFEGDEARSWLARGLAIVRRELPEQVLPDGGNFERSPMYHAIFLEDLLDLINAADAWPGHVADHTVREWRATAARMREWLDLMCHPDGELSLFNDAAIGIAPSPAELHAYAHRLGMRDVHEDAGRSQRPSQLDPGMHYLRDSGYLRIDWSDAMALVDVAPIGPDYLPAHAHADSLGFELSIGQRRVIVDSGTSCYGTGPERQRQRSTSAHNTVEVDGQDSSEVWGGFRVARRARIRWADVAQGVDTVRVQAEHDGYIRLRGRNLHRRSWLASPSRLCVEDTVTGPYRQALARWYFHPDLALQSTDGSWCARVAGETVARIHFDGAGGVRLASATWHPRFGKSIPNQCLVVELQGGSLRTTIDWSVA